MDYAKELGSNLPAGSKQVVVFVPEKNIDGEPIDQEYWVEQVLKCFGKLFRGATAFPPGKGVWRNDEKKGELLIENTTMVVSFVDPESFDHKNIQHLREFLHRMGRQANQGEIGIVIDNNYYGISKYDSPREEERR